MKTNAEWVEHEQVKAMMIDPERIHLILDQPEHMVAIYLAMADGFRALISNCIYENNNQLL